MGNICVGNDMTQANIYATQDKHALTKGGKRGLNPHSDENDLSKR